MQHHEQGGAAPSGPDDRVETIRRQVMHGIATNRIQGLHFPGYFLGLRKRRFEREGIALDLPFGPHCVTPDGRLSVLAFGPFADMVLASAVRPLLTTAERTATLSMHLNFTGVPMVGELVGEAVCHGFSGDSVLPQAYCRGSMRSAAGVVCYGAGTFGRLDSPPGVELHPLPWARAEMPPTPQVGKRDLTVTERKIARLAESCLTARAAEASFIERFWGGRVTTTPGGARGSFPLGPHTGNRVGHVQGGLMAAFAAVTACAAVPRHHLLESLSAWYISPGHGQRLTARSEVLQDGRNLAVVRTQVFAAGRKRVLEVVTNHAVARRAAAHLHGHAT
jgi:acyl-coenzyme A thioesterase PaaI-like protein